MAEVVAANHLDTGRLRLTVTGGVSPLGSDRGSAGPAVVVAAAPLPAWEPATAVVTVERPRNERSAVAGLKTTSYAENVVALERAHGQGASEAIFANTQGRLCEGTGSNIFVGVGGRLVTPPARRRAAWPASPASWCASWWRWTRSTWTSPTWPRSTRPS